MISTSELFDIGSGIKRICEENRVYLDALIKKDAEIERLRRIIWNLLDDGDETDRTEALAARAALKGDE